MGPYIQPLPGQRAGQATVWEHSSGRVACVYTSAHHYLVAGAPSWRRLYRIRWRLK